MLFCTPLVRYWGLKRPAYADRPLLAPALSRCPRVAATVKLDGKLHQFIWITVYWLILDRILNLFD